MAEPDTGTPEPPTEAAIIASMGADDPADEAVVSPAVDEQGDEVVTEPTEPEPEDTSDDPPEFWSVEKKEIFRGLTPEAKAAVREHYEEATRSTNKKIEEAAFARKAAEDARTAAESAAKQHIANQEQLAAWWQSNGQNIARMVQGKWAGWTPEYQVQLAANDPAEYTRLKAAHDADMAQLTELGSRHQAQVKEVEARRAQEHQQERAAEHEKLAKKYPNEFAGDKAQKTYDTLSKYLLEQGIAPDRLQGIYEDAVVSTVLKAYKYDQLQAKAKGVTDPKQAAAPASTTPRRVTPGAARPASQVGNQERQALERLRNGESSEEVERWAFR